MKKVALVLSLGVLSLTSLSADYQLTLIDKDGVETKQCIKSYSFSNNLESIARQNGLYKDVYSEEEVLTNKIYLGKPVYRRVFKDVMGFNENGAFNDWKIIRFNNQNDNVEKVVSGEIDFNNKHEHYNIYSLNHVQFRYEILPYGISYVSKGSYVDANTKATVILEYTKTTDNVDDSKNTFKSYLHYVPSSSENEEVITKNLESSGVQFLENYTYDRNTDSCIKNQ